MRRVGPPADAEILGSTTALPTHSRMRRVPPLPGACSFPDCSLKLSGRSGSSLLASASKKAPTRYHASVPASRSRTARTASSTRSATTFAVKDETETRILLSRLGLQAALPLPRHALSGRTADPRFEAHVLFSGVYVLRLRTGAPPAPALEAEPAARGESHVRGPGAAANRRRAARHQAAPRW
jgi:hypothetical protein